jgi:predicted transcriptional regulator
MEEQNNVAEIEVLKEYPVNWEYLRQLMKERGYSYSELERKSKVPMSTVRKVLRGQSDARINSVIPVLIALKGDANTLFGITPVALPAKDQTAVDIAMADAMRAMIETSMQQYSEADAAAIAKIGLLGAQVAELKQLVADQDERLLNKRGLLDDQRSEIARLNERVEAREATIAALYKAIKWICIGSGAAILFMLLFDVFFI